MILQINRAFVAVTLLLGIVFPTAFPLFKTLLFGGAIITALVWLMMTQITLSRGLVLISLFYGIIGAVYSCYGEIQGNPGAARVLTVMLAYPLLFPILSFTYQNDDDQKILRLIWSSAWLLVVVDGLYIVGSIFSPLSFVFNTVSEVYKNSAIVDNAEDYFKFTLPNISSLIFLIPFFISILFSGINRAEKIKVVLLLVLMSALAVLSGRRALFLAFFIGPALTWLLSVFFVGKTKGSSRHSYMRFIYAAGFVAILIFAISAFSNSFQFYISQIQSIFDFTGNQSNLERYLQFDALVDGISRAPVFGNGAGAAASYSRSSDQPWAYELSYVAFVFQYGLLGAVCYLLGIVLLIYGLIWSAKKNRENSFQFAFLSGFLSFMFANASNPYLAKFDYMWLIFIPLAIFFEGSRARNASK